MGDPFTNLQDGLRLASEMLRRRPVPEPARDRRDRRPAPLRNFADGRLHCEWPRCRSVASLRAAAETLKERWSA